MIKYFTIYGERCSGTNFLEKTILENLNVSVHYDFNWKHFFGFYNFINIEKENETLFIGIVKEPIEWINSLFRDLHHIPSENRINIDAFLLNEFYSIEDNKEIMEDRNMITKKRYSNIFELRKVKNDFLINKIQKLVKNYVLIKYEDLCNNHDNVLDYICTNFNIQKKNNPYVKIIKYKGKENYNYKRKEIQIESDKIEIIKKSLDKEQEKILGYEI